MYFFWYLVPSRYILLRALDVSVYITCICMYYANGSKDDVRWNRYESIKQKMEDIQTPDTKLMHEVKERIGNRYKKNMNK
ncbi:hypothetical protein BDV29DRAFT_148744 [Aspergillus leporis]|uniref:Uncharacterized protein n=1 Tax=Aspergillus leporis TaxID=41062 RepID=A0A5N5WWG1_9EURO|nr:hypothetical protein BDV29DRAFT_148744 [Aspergillus leporis]